MLGGSSMASGEMMKALVYHGPGRKYVRVPFAENSTYRVPGGVTDEDLLMLSDILPTGYEVGVLNGGVRPGDVVAVVGSGPIGLSAIMGARLFSRVADRWPRRRHRHRSRRRARGFAAHDAQQLCASRPNGGRSDRRQGSHG